MAKKEKRAKDKRKKISQRVGTPSTPSPEELERLQRLVERGGADRVLEEGERLLKTHPRDPQVHSILGQLYARLGSETKAYEHLEAAARLAPSVSELDYVRAINYESLGIHSHALRAARRYLASAPSGEDAAYAAQIVQTVEDSLAKWAVGFDISVKRMEQGSFLMEEGRLALDSGDFVQAYRLSKEASSLLPKWAVPRNNAAVAQFYLGNAPSEKDGIAIEELVLAELDPNNIHALANLVHFHIALGNDEQAKTYGDRLVKLRPVYHDDFLKMAEAFRFLGRDQLVHDLLAKAKPPNARAEKEREWLMGIAAANLGKLKEAHSHLSRADVESDPFRSKIANLIDAGLPGPGGRYPYHSAVQDLPQSLIKRIVSRLGDKETVGAQSLRDMAKKYPALVDIAAEWMWLDDGDVAKKAVEALRTIGSERAIELLRSFATSQVGSDEVRTYAATSLANLKSETPDEPMVIFRHGKPTPILLREFTIVTVKEPAYSRDIHRMLEEAIIAQRKGQADKAEQLYYRILAKNPKVKEAISNLGGIYFARGDTQRGEEQYRKAITIDPLYVSARANLASLRLEEGKIEEAKEWLRPLIELREWHVEEMVRYQGVFARVAMAEKRFDDAENHLKLILDLEPDDQWAKDTIDRLIVMRRLAELPNTFSDWLQQLRDRYRERKQKQLISPDESLLTLLSRYSKDALVGVSREISLSSVSGLKKDALLAVIREVLHDPESLRSVMRVLTEEDLAALRFVLQAGGMMPLAEFGEKYGDDADESPHWNFRVPETVLGRLKVRGLIFEGTYKGQIVLVVPAELRSIVQTIAARRERTV